MTSFTPLLLSMVVGSLNPPLVVLDPGHGGVHDGAVGICGLKEKTLTLSVAKHVAQLLNASKQARASLTRQSDTDVDLRARTQFANQSQAALFVSIHANASEFHHAHGIETYFLASHVSNEHALKFVARENAEAHPGTTVSGTDIEAILDKLHYRHAHKMSQKAAITFQETVSRTVGSKSRGVYQAPFLVLHEANMPALLVEIGFLSHAKECASLADANYQKKIGQGIAIAILKSLAQIKPQTKSTAALPFPLPTR